MSEFESDLALVKGIAEQDDKAINYLYTQVGPTVKKYIMASGGSEEEAEDVFQEGIISCYINIQNGKYALNSNTKFSTYLTQVCKFKWYDILKSSHKKTAKNTIIETGTEENMQDLLEQNEQCDALHKAIGQIGEQCKSILMKFYWEKKSVEEISQSLQMTAASVKNGKYRCMQKLKEKANELKQYR